MLTFGIITCFPEELLFGADFDDELTTIFEELPELLRELELLLELTAENEL